MGCLIQKPPRLKVTSWENRWYTDVQSQQNWKDALGDRAVRSWPVPFIWSWWRNVWDTICISILRILISGNCYIRNVWTCNQRTSRLVFSRGLCVRKRSAQEWTLRFDLELHGVCHAASRQRKAGLIPRVVLNPGRGTVFESGVWKLVHTRSWIIFAQFASPIELFLLYFSDQRRQVFEQDGKAGEWEDIRSWCLQIQTNLKWYRLSGKRLQKKTAFFCGTCEVSIVSILPDGTWNSSFCHLGVTGGSHRGSSKRFGTWKALVPFGQHGMTLDEEMQMMKLKGKAWLLPSILTKQKVLWASTMVFWSSPIRMSSNGYLHGTFPPIHSLSLGVPAWWRSYCGGVE